MVPWVEGGRSLLHMIPYGPGWAEIHRTPVSFAWHIELNSTLGRLVTPDFLLSGTLMLYSKVGAVFHSVSATRQSNWAGHHVGVQELQHPSTTRYTRKRFFTSVYFYQSYLRGPLIFTLSYFLY